MERFKSLVVVACSLHKSVQFVQSRQSLMQLTRVSSECQLCEFLVHECVVNFCNPVSFWQNLHLRLAIVYGGKFWACVLARSLMPLCLRQTFVTIFKMKVFYFCERCSRSAPLSRIMPQHAGDADACSLTVSALMTRSARRGKIDSRPLYWRVESDPVKGPKLWESFVGQARAAFAGGPVELRHVVVAGAALRSCCERFHH